MVNDLFFRVGKRKPVTCKIRATLKIKSFHWFTSLMSDCQILE